MNEMLRVAEVGKALSLTTRHTYALIANGSLPCVRMGRTVRVPKDALDAWLRERYIPAHAAQTLGAKSSIQ